MGSKGHLLIALFLCPHSDIAHIVHRFDLNPGIDGDMVYSVIYMQTIMNKLDQHCLMK